MPTLRRGLQLGTVLTARGPFLTLCLTVLTPKGPQVRFEPRFLFILPMPACGTDGWSGPVSAPGAVASVVTTVNNGDVQVNWPAVPGAISYTVYMASQSGVTHTNVATLPGNMTHPGLSTVFDHPPGLEADSTWHFVVTAVNSAGEGPESCEVTARITGSVGGSC